MKKKINISNGNTSIPAIVWGNPSTKILIEVHGNLSNKEDAVISLTAKRAVDKGYQVVSFDLPKHGARAHDDYACTPPNCISDLHAVYKYAKSLGSEISVFGCSMGAYFTLLAYHEHNIKQSLFLSPVVNMERIIKSLMQGFNISEDRLEAEKQIELPIGEVLDWDYYTFVRENPITFDWNMPTNILYGSNDTVCDLDDVLDFSTRYQAEVKVDDNGEHYYHTEEHLETVSQWLNKVLV